MTAPMKLSDAILKGCEIIPRQAFGVAFVDADGEKCHPEDAFAACALGAAEIATGLQDLSNVYPAFAIYDCPECGSDIRRGSVIVHLNDDHRWSRERIAEWLKEQGL